MKSFSLNIVFFFKSVIQIDIWRFEDQEFFLSLQIQIQT